MLTFIAILVVVGVRLLSGQLVRNNERAVKRHKELVELIKELQTSRHGAETEATT
ncbi:MAG: hypothetical protein AAF351_00305 [Pseudomonadota bacterium]